MISPVVELAIIGDDGSRANDLIDSRGRALEYYHQSIGFVNIKTNFNMLDIITQGYSICSYGPALFDAINPFYMHPGYLYIYGILDDIYEPKLYTKVINKFSGSVFKGKYKKMVLSTGINICFELAYLYFLINTTGNTNGHVLIENLRTSITYASCAFRMFYSRPLNYNKPFASQIWNLSRWMIFDLSVLAVESNHRASSILIRKYAFANNCFMYNCAGTFESAFLDGAFLFEKIATISNFVSKYYSVFSSLLLIRYYDPVFSEFSGIGPSSVVAQVIKNYDLPVEINKVRKEEDINYGVFIDGSIAYVDTDLTSHQKSMYDIIQEVEKRYDWNSNIIYSTNYANLYIPIFSLNNNGYSILDCIGLASAYAESRMLVPILSQCEVYRFADDNPFMPCNFFDAVPRIMSNLDIFFYYYHQNIEFKKVSLVEVMFKTSKMFQSIKERIKGYDQKTQDYAFVKSKIKSVINCFDYYENTDAASIIRNHDIMRFESIKILSSAMKRYRNYFNDEMNLLLVDNIDQLGDNQLIDIYLSEYSDSQTLKLTNYLSHVIPTGEVKYNLMSGEKSNIYLSLNTNKFNKTQSSPYLKFNYIDNIGGILVGIVEGISISNYIFYELDKTITRALYSQLGCVSTIFRQNLSAEITSLAYRIEQVLPIIISQFTFKIVLGDDPNGFARHQFINSIYKFGTVHGLGISNLASAQLLTHTIFWSEMYNTYNICSYSLNNDRLGKNLLNMILNSTLSMSTYIPNRYYEFLIALLPDIFFEYHHKGYRMEIFFKQDIKKLICGKLYKEEINIACPHSTYSKSLKNHFNDSISFKMFSALFNYGIKTKTGLTLTSMLSVTPGNTSKATINILDLFHYVSTQIFVANTLYRGGPITLGIPYILSQRTGLSPLAHYGRSGFLEAYATVRTETKYNPATLPFEDNVDDFMPDNYCNGTPINRGANVDFIEKSIMDRHDYLYFARLAKIYIDYFSPLTLLDIDFMFIFKNIKYYQGNSDDKMIIINPFKIIRDGIINFITIQSQYSGRATRYFLSDYSFFGHIGTRLNVLEQLTRVTSLAFAYQGIQSVQYKHMYNTEHLFPALISGIVDIFTHTLSRAQFVKLDVAINGKKQSDYEKSSTFGFKTLIRYFNYKTFNNSIYVCPSDSEIILMYQSKNIGVSINKVESLIWYSIGFVTSYTKSTYAARCLLKSFLSIFFSGRLYGAFKSNYAIAQDDCSFEFRLFNGDFHNIARLNLKFNVIPGLKSALTPYIDFRIQLGSMRKISGIHNQIYSISSDALEVELY